MIIIAPTKCVVRRRRVSLCRFLCNSPQSFSIGELLAMQTRPNPDSTWMLRKELPKRWRLGGSRLRQLPHALASKASIRHIAEQYLMRAETLEKVPWPPKLTTTAVTTASNTVTFQLFVLVSRPALVQPKSTACSSGAFANKPLDRLVLR